MTLQHFNRLSAEGQREAILFNGVFLGCRESCSFTVLLYGIEGFYVEVFSSKKEQAIVRVNSFESTEKLEPYLDSIDVKELV